jgi:hypothetical protein
MGEHQLFFYCNSEHNQSAMELLPFMCSSSLAAAAGGEEVEL